MGLFDFITQGISNVAQTGKTIAANTLSTLGVNNTFTTQNKSSFTSPIPLAAKVAEHPFTTAAIATTVINPAAALTVAKQALSTTVKFTTNLVNTLSPLQKVGATAAALVAVPAVANSKKLQNSIINTPKSLVTFGSNIGNVVDNPSVASVKQLAVDSPVLTSATGVAALALVSGGVGLAANTAATFLNSQSTKGNTKAMLGDAQNVMSAMPVAFDTGLSKLEAKAAKTQQESDFDLQKLIGQQQLDIIEAQTKQAKELASLNPTPVAATVSSTPLAVAATPTKKKKKKKKKAPKKKKKTTTKKKKKAPKKKKKTKKYKKTKKKKK